MSETPYDLAARAAEALLAATGGQPLDAAVVLGSGWREGAAGLGTPVADVATTDLPGFVAPSVAGHSGRVLVVEHGGRRLALLSGRVHLYEGHEVARVVHPVRTLVGAGARTVVLTNAAGGIDPTLVPGSVVLIRDHLNLTATSPLEGVAPPPPHDTRFVDLSDLYSAELRAAVRERAPELTEGVYAGLRGPHYETPAEIVMLRALGASVVGMSTVLEAIAAHHLGARVLGLALVSNPAAGVAAAPLDHREVLEAGQAAAASLGELLARIAPVL